MRGAKVYSSRMAGCIIFCLLAGCGQGGSVSTQPNTPPSDPSSPPTISSYVPLTQTAFIGDEITLAWPQMDKGGATFGVYGLATGTTEQISAQLSTQDKCISGCGDGLFQSLVNSGMKRAVLLMGTYDVLDSEPCSGAATAVWDGNAGDSGDPTIRYYPEIISGAQDFYPQVSLVIGTIPPLGAKSPLGTSFSSACSSIVETLNTEIKAMAAKYGVPVVDFNSALSQSDISTTGDYIGIVPNTAGYTAMTNLYNQENQ